MKEIHFAGGCFWGAEHYFKSIEGVLDTEVGFANGSLPDPSYEQVYTDTTGHAETVRVAFNPVVLPLEELVRDFFVAIDPLAVDHQGGDFGTRYRTGIYYSDPEDLPVILKVYGEVSRDYGFPLAVEVKPLEGFYPAEDRHQDYLDKNPGGYCHLPLKLFRYPRLLRDLKALLGDEPDRIARLSNAAALLKERMGFFWVGFYMVGDADPSGRSSAHGGALFNGQELILGPFQGPPACIRIGYGGGVCGTAWKEGRTIVVPDVEAFPGHIACSAESRSEIVIPLRSGGEIVGVLDIDSAELSTFDRIDAFWLERFAGIIL